MNYDGSIFLYDGYCIFCIKVVRGLNFLRSIKLLDNSKHISLLPYQKSSSILKKYSLSIKLVEKRVHLITNQGIIYTGENAIYNLNQYFPILSPLLIAFRTPFGKWIYKIIADNRYQLWACCKGTKCTNRLK